MVRTVRKNYSKWFFTKVKHAVLDYKMIENGDKVAVGISGGKDSTALLFILSLLKKWSDFDFDIYPVSLDLGLGADFSPVEEFCREEKLPYHIEKTQIGKIVFEIRNEKNPCALCAKMRRGALHNTAIKLNCNKVALGHHLDDAIETFFLNLCHTGQFSTFEPKTYLSRTGLWLIRPMIYLTEDKIKSIVKHENLPIIENPCTISGTTQRENMKEILNFLQNQYPEIKNRFLTAFRSAEPICFWPKTD